MLRREGNQKEKSSMMRAHERDAPCFLVLYMMLLRWDGKSVYIRTCIITGGSFKKKIPLAKSLRLSDLSQPIMAPHWFPLWMLLRRSAYIMRVCVWYVLQHHSHTQPLSPLFHPWWCSWPRTLYALMPFILHLRHPNTYPSGTRSFFCISDGAAALRSAEGAKFAHAHCCCHCGKIADGRSFLI